MIRRRTQLAKGYGVNYAKGALYDSFPQWYKQWNRLVPTMCVRISDVGFEQKLCPYPKEEE